MDEMYEVAQQAKYMFLKIDEVYKIDGGMKCTKLPDLLRILNMNTPDLSLSES